MMTRHVVTFVFLSIFSFARCNKKGLLQEGWQSNWNIKVQTMITVTLWSQCDILPFTVLAFVLSKNDWIRIVFGFPKMTDYKYDRLTCILIESIIVDFWWTFLVLTFTFVFYRISDTIKHDIMKNNIPHFLHCTINCISHLVHYIMERSPAVFSFHPICSPQIDLSTPSNQCGINCMKPHLHTYTSPSPTQPHTTSTCISSPTPHPWKPHKAHTDEMGPDWPDWVVLVFHSPPPLPIFSLISRQYLA